MRCFIRYKVTAREQLTQQIVGEYLMFFQNNTRRKFTIAQNQTLFFHQFYQPGPGCSKHG